MVKKGSIEVGCGKYSYSLEGPPKAPPPAATPVKPFISCKIWYSILFWRFGINFTTNEAALHDAIKGCGAVTGWKVKPDVDGIFYVTFNLPLTLKNGCVERAIKSAGGPGISCHK